MFQPIVQGLALKPALLPESVDQDSRDREGQRYIAFHLEDGTAEVRSFWPESGELSRGIIAPASFQVSVLQALAGARAFCLPRKGSAALLMVRCRYA